MLESTIERRLKIGVKGLKAGALCLKLECPGYTGVPDRMILLPGGRAVFVELKKPGEKERPRQRYVQDRMRELGFDVRATMDSVEKVDALIEELRRMVESG